MGTRDKFDFMFPPGVIMPTHRLAAVAKRLATLPQPGSVRLTRDAGSGIAMRGTDGDDGDDGACCVSPPLLLLPPPPRIAATSAASLALSGAPSGTNSSFSGLAKRP